MLLFGQHRQKTGQTMRIDGGEGCRRCINSLLDWRPGSVSEKFRKLNAKWCTLRKFKTFEL